MINISVTVSGSSAVVCVETEGTASVIRNATEYATSENQSLWKQFHVGQANLIRHMRMERNDNACLLRLQQV